MMVTTTHHIINWENASLPLQLPLPPLFVLSLYDFNDVSLLKREFTILSSHERV
jgi:hypothetical protein